MSSRGNSFGESNRLLRTVATWGGGMMVWTLVNTGCFVGTIGATLDRNQTLGDPGDSIDTGSDSSPADGDARPEGDEHAADADGDPGPAPGDPARPPSELLLFEGGGLQFTYDDNGFHPLIQPGETLPADNWLSPIDYFQGQFQIRYLVEGPPDQAAGRLQTCIWTMGDADGDGRNYFPEACSAQVDHDGVGTYFNDRLVPADWWANEGVPLDFSHPDRFLIRVVLRGTSGCNVTRHDVSNPCWDEWPSYENMTFRVTMVMVAEGETFSGWETYP